jgi:sulfite reductase (NADPH) flavoprotein alpha-component
MVPVLPSSAPFSPDQRAFLNGYFAALFGADVAPANGHANGNGAAPFAADSHSLNRVGSDSGGNDLIPAPPSSAAAVNGVAPVASAPEADEEMPWHDAALSLDERMALAEGKPLKLKLMAAMAQLDCGQCGYLCKSYAEAIADGSEKSLKKCVPGEKPTALKLKELMA